MGAFRTVDEAGHPIVTDGELVGTSDSDGPFAGALDLIARLSSSRDLESCVVLQWFRYGHGREELTADQCTMDGLAEAFAASDGDIRELLVAITRSDAFRFRTPGE